MDFELKDKNGMNIKCELLYTLEDKKNKYNYIIYTTGELDEQNKKVVYASRYELQGNDYILKDIENDSEWDLIDAFLASKRK